ncbi:hypothetical protein HY949_02095 [Candidatus Gottesmanbacteria bacterium]|nr:hypothetical protein [Candidatus Gottesmanbacteria bacterium]
MGHGVWETVKSQVKWAIGGGLVGAIGGGLVGALTGRTLTQNKTGRSALEELLNKDEVSELGIPWKPLESGAAIPALGAGAGALIGAGIGETIGFETAGRGYNKKIVTKNNLPPTRWYDWVVSNVGLTGLKLVVPWRNYRRAGPIGMLIANEVFNPITVAGMRAVGKGLWEMRTPQRA